MFRLKMSPSLDIYSFGMVVLFLFSEKYWWNSGPKPPRSPDKNQIALRSTQIDLLIAEMAGIEVLQNIAQQIQKMLHDDPKQRPDASSCRGSFTLCKGYHEV